MTVLASDFGYGTIVGNIGVDGDTVGFTTDTNNYFTVTNVVAAENHWTVEAKFGGEYCDLGYYPGGDPGPHIKIEIVNAGRWRAIKLYSGVTTDAFVLVGVFPAYGMPDTVTWAYTTWTGLGFTATPDTLVYNAATPCVNDASWYPKQKEAVLDGAYRRVTILAADGSVAHTYSNGTDGEDALVSVDVTEFFDHTTTKAQINSARFSIHTPFDAGTSQATIAAFIAGFAKNTAFQVEGGWKALTSMGYDTYDTTSMGHYFITSAKLNKDSWTVEVEGEDAFGLLAQTTFPDCPTSDFVFEGQLVPWAVDSLLNVDTAVDSILATAPATNLTSEDLFLTLDPALANLRFFAPLQADVTSLDLLQRFTNYSGGRWYLGQNGHKILELEAIANLDYKITPQMMFGNPVAEEYEQPTDPHRVAAYSYTQNYDNAGTIETICEVPRVGGLDALGSPKEMIVSHAGAWAKKVYGRVGETETEVTGVIDPATEHLYNTLIPASAWIISGTSFYDALVIKGLPLSETASDSGISAIGSAIENPLVVRGQEQNAILSWSFPDNESRAYRWSMRDDPSLKCGNVVQLAVDNEYLNVLLIEAKRSFAGAGRMDCLAVYVSDTGTVVYETVSNPTMTRSPLETTTAILASGESLDDTLLRAAFPTTNYSTTTSNYARLGNDDERRSLIRFDLTAAPAGTLVSATMTMRRAVETFPLLEGTVTEQFQRILVPWTPGQVTWDIASTGVPWTTGGCSGAGTDHESAVIASRTSDAATDQYGDVVTLALDTDLVQEWLDGTTENYGVVYSIVRPDYAVYGRRMYGFDHADPTLHPVLTLVYVDYEGVFDWTPPTGYEGWSNVDLSYLIYNTTPATPTLLGTVPYGDTSYTTPIGYNTAATFGIAVRVNGHEYAPVAIS